MLFLILNLLLLFIILILKSILSYLAVCSHSGMNLIISCADTPNEFLCVICNFCDLGCELMLSVSCLSQMCCCSPGLWRPCRVAVSCLSGDLWIP